MKMSDMLAGALVVAGMGMAGVVLGSDGPTTNLYVSPSGNDAWSGTLQTPNSAGNDGPKATVDGARAALRTMLAKHQVGVGGAVVTIMPGSYALTQTIQFYGADSGASGAPIVYRAAQPGTVEIMGGVVLKTWNPISDESVAQRLPGSIRGNVLEADLAVAGVTDLGKRQRIGFYGARVPTVPEIFFENRPMSVAHSPTSGWARTSTAPVPAGWSFTYDGDDLSTWSPENDLWVHGFFHYDYADYTEHVVAVDPALHAVRTDSAPSYGFVPGARFVFQNVLEALDSPGEYYIDVKRNKAYFYPPARQADGRTVVSTLAAPLVRLDNASHIRFEGLSLRICRGDGVMVNGGDDIDVVGCTISGVGMHGIEASNVTHTLIQSTDVSNVGYSGIVLSGGDRATLTSGFNVIQNCHIALTGRVVMTSEAAIRLAGVGTVVKNCSIHDVPQGAIYVMGNNNVISSNEIYRACLQSSDAGALYIGRNFADQGNVFQGNYLHDIKPSVEPNPVKGHGNTYQINAVYLDDFASGASVIGNVFQNVDVAVMIGGGRDNTIQNNAFLHCHWAIVGDARGNAGSKQFLTDPNSVVLKELRDVDYQGDVFGKAYPNLAKLLSDDPGTPKRNRVANNVSYIGGWMNMTKDYPMDLNPVMSNCVGVDPGFEDLASLDLTPKEGAPAAQAGFHPVNAKSAGLVVDAYRAGLPTTGQMPNQ
jgi:hypothetical protein